MRGLLVWFIGTAIAFFITASAFLLLANFGSNTSERSLEPRSPSSRLQLPLELNFNKDRLGSLKTLPAQKLSVNVKNQGSSIFSKVSLTLRVSSEDTRLSRSRYYQGQVSNLKAGGSETVQFELDLSPFSGSRKEDPLLPGNPERSRILLEVQATTPEGISTVKTAVLPFPDGGST